MLFEEIAPAGPLELTRLRKLRSDLSRFFIAGGAISALVRIALLG